MEQIKQLDEKKALLFKLHHQDFKFIYKEAKKDSLFIIYEAIRYAERLGRYFNPEAKEHTPAYWLHQSWQETASFYILKSIYIKDFNQLQKIRSEHEQHIAHIKANLPREYRTTW